MSRIRTVKPEWLDDERLLTSGSDARVLSIALIILSDDHGRGRLTLSTPSRVFPETPENFREAFARLSGWFVEEYSVRGQRYFQIVNWQKHQKVDKPGKPQVPPPETPQISDSRKLSRESRETPENFRETLAPDLDQDRDLDLDPREEERRPMADRVARQLALTPTPGSVARLLELISALHCHSSGRPYAEPGMPSSNDRKLLAGVIAVAQKLAEGSGLDPMRIIAAEWVALLSLVANGDKPDIRNALAYFAKCFGGLEDARADAGAPHVPARHLEVAA